MIGRWTRARRSGCRARARPLTLSAPPGAAGHRETGATGAEYALVASLIAVAIVAAVQVFGQQVTSLFAAMATSI